jgi:hypothetical protein
VKYWEIIADNLSKAGWSWGCISGVDSNGRTIFVADTHRDDGQRFIVHADEKLTAFVELESAIRPLPQFFELGAGFLFEIGRGNRNPVHALAVADVNYSIFSRDKFELRSGRYSVSPERNRLRDRHKLRCRSWR